MSFTPVSDEVAVRVLIDDLSTLAPIANKSFEAKVGDETFMLWYNRSLDAINMQLKGPFAEQKATGKIGIRRTNTVLTYYYENSQVSGVPSSIGEKIEEAAKLVRKAKKLFDKGVSFDPESLKLIFEYMKEGSMNSDNPLKVTIDHEKYNLWIKRIRQAPAGCVARGGIEPEPEVKYYLNCQDQKRFDECVQDNKLGLEIDEEGKIVSVVTDGKARPPEENEALLYDSDGIWNIRLTKIVREILSRFGFSSDKQKVTVHLLTIKKIPEVVLCRWSKLKPKPQRVSFMNDQFHPGPGIDAGGLTKQFFSDLASSLFDGKGGRAFKVDESGCPFTPEGGALDKALAAAFGDFLSEISRRELSVGRVLPESFFALLKAVVTTPKASQARTTEVAALFAGEYQKSIVAWLQGDAGQKDTALEMMGYAGEEGLDDLPEAKQRERAVRYLGCMAEPYIRAAEAIAGGLSKALKDAVRGTSAVELCAQVQGNPIDADDVCARISLSLDNSVLREKVEMLKAHIRERVAAGDVDWVERFLFCVTGQRAVKATTQIRISRSHDGMCRAHTCSNTLDLPATHQTPPTGVKDKRARFVANLEITMAETGMSAA